MLEQLSRRSFLRGTLSVTSAAILVKPSDFLRRPTIWSDGVHDDWEGLQALFDRKSVDIVGDATRVFSGGDISINGGWFLLSRTLRIKRSDWFIMDSRFYRSPDFDGDYMINIDHGAMGTLASSWFGPDTIS
jgi:hypothetical protein